MARSRFGVPLAFLLIASTAAGCAARSPAPQRPSAAPGSRQLQPLDRLRAELASAFETPSVNALWAVKVQSLDTGEVLYEQNAHRLVMPASNMKIVTLSVAAERLGWDFTFTTTLETAGRVAAGTLDGDLIVVADGDPTIGGRGGPATRVFEAWADRLREQGITRIAGRIVGDDHALDDRALGEGWAWDDLSAGYAAAPGALQFNENAVSLVVRARGEPGQPASLVLEPEGSGLTLTGEVTIGAEATAPAVIVWRRPFDTRVEVSGTAPRSERDYVRTLAVDNPTQFYVNVLRETLVRRGIPVEGPAVDIDDLAAAPAAPGSGVPGGPARTVLLTHASPPLREIAVTFMKESQNLFGETLLNRIGLQAGLEPCPHAATPATCRGRAVRAGRQAYEQVLAVFGVPPSEFIVGDGSGLSRYDFVTADLLVTLLRRMARDPRHAAAFDATLPVMGRDGTLRRRMRGTRAEGAVRAKTGSIANVRALSGYLATADGERLAFSIVGNNFKAPAASVDAIAEQAIERLVNFRR